MAGIHSNSSRISMENLENGTKNEAAPSASASKALPQDQSPTITLPWGSRSYQIQLKYLCLFVLIIQTTVNINVMRYSRMISQPSGVKYLSSTTVFLSEVVKLSICYMILLKNESFDFRSVNKALKVQLFEKWEDTLKVSVPAFLFVLQNNLLFMAITELNTVLYQVTYQLKIVTTAIFFVAMLGRRLTWTQWISLIILFVGVCLVQIPSDGSNPMKMFTGGSDGKVFGMFAVIAACITSGFSGVYFEKILKGSQVSVWMRNIQLASCSILISAVTIAWNDFEAISTNGFFQGYNYVTFYVVFSQGVGGLIIAAVVKYADNILKGFATALSIILSSVVSYYIFQDFIPTRFFFSGSTLVILSTYLYGRPSSSS